MICLDKICVFYNCVKILKLKDKHFNFYYYRCNVSSLIRNEACSVDAKWKVFHWFKKTSEKWRYISTFECAKTWQANTDCYIVNAILEGLTCATDKPAIKWNSMINRRQISQTILWKLWDRYRNLPEYICCYWEFFQIQSLHTNWMESAVVGWN